MLSASVWLRVAGSTQTLSLGPAPRHTYPDRQSPCAPVCEAAALLSAVACALVAGSTQTLSPANASRQTYPGRHVPGPNTPADTTVKVPLTSVTEILYGDGAVAFTLAVPLSGISHSI